MNNYRHNSNKQRAAFETESYISGSANFEQSYEERNHGNHADPLSGYGSPRDDPYLVGQGERYSPRSRLNDPYSPRSRSNDPYSGRGGPNEQYSGRGEPSDPYGGRSDPYSRDGSGGREHPFSGRKPYVEDPPLKASRGREEGYRAGEMSERGYQEDYGGGRAGGRGEVERRIPAQFGSYSSFPVTPPDSPEPTFSPTLTRGAPAGVVMQGGRRGPVAPLPLDEEVVHELDHLATFTVSQKQRLVTADDGMRQLREMEATSGVWTMRVQVKVSRKEVVVVEKKTGKEIEYFPISRIRDPVPIRSNNSNDIYNNVLIFTVEGDGARTPAEMNAFQCIGVSAQEVADDINAACIGKFPRRPAPLPVKERPRSYMADPVPQRPFPGPPPGRSRPYQGVSPQRPYPVDPRGFDDDDDDESVVKGYTNVPVVGGRQRAARTPDIDVDTDDDTVSLPPLALNHNNINSNERIREKKAAPPPVTVVALATAAAPAAQSAAAIPPNVTAAAAPVVEDLQKEMQQLNNCLDDIERFVTALQQAANATRELTRAEEAGNANQLDLDLLRKRALAPSTADFVDVFQKFKFALNLLPILKNVLKDPNVEDMSRQLFAPLTLVLDASKDSKGEYKLANTVISPLLTMETCRLLDKILIRRDVDLWQSLGECWVCPKERWQGTVPAPYIPVFGRPLQTTVVLSSRPPETRPAAQPSNSNGSNPSAVKVETQAVVEPVPRSANEPAAQSPSLSQETYLNELKAKNCKVCQVVADRAGANTKELTITDGEYLEVITDDKNWWKLRNVRGEQGHAPKNFLKPIHGY